ncbi:hypothetical protein ACFO4P_05630 [Epilithonimonas pallida]|uniref:LTXXQ motif family protein n=1 Tax=Epilithonimonas pallida TaxID=373671 RepID=A0ABY1R281_9FLAO|nr:hypothetical protein [Epilithonimonas pallida]SMP89668.1 hypothetical protein SAMN05421679_10260 [Epilithonimonas pallida]
MKKLLLTIFIAGLFSAHTVRGQERRSANTVQRSTGNSSFRSAPTSSFSPAGTAMRQQQSQNIPRASEWRAMNMDEKRAAVSNMSVKERSVFLQKMKENITIDDLDIPADKQEEFKNLFTEYQSNQRLIKEKFHSDKNFDKLSDEEATSRLNQSFDVGQQLLNNRRAYADKFLKILTPQQVLKLFQNEGKMREKMLDKKNDK